MDMLEDDKNNIYFDITTERPLIKQCFNTDWKQRSSN